MNEFVDQVKFDIIEAIESDRIVLPTLPEVALQVRRAASDEDVDVHSLADVISNDTAMSARIIKVANSPLLRANASIDDLKTAVSRLGISYTANLATGLAMQQMFVATSDVVARRMREVWAKSTEVAGISHVLASQYSNIKPDQATLAGLVHQIGVLPILTYAEDNNKLLENESILDTVIEQAHPAIGGRILQAWEFPLELQAVPEESVNFQREVAAPDISDVVMIASLQGYIGTDHPVTRMDWSTISAFNRLGLDPEINTLEVEDLSQEMEAAMALLH